MTTFNIDEIMQKSPKTESKGLNNTQKRKNGIQKLAEIEFLPEYTEEQKNAILSLKKSMGNCSMKSYQQLKLFVNSVEDIKTDLIKLAQDINEAESQGVMDTVLKLYLAQ